MSVLGSVLGLLGVAAAFRPKPEGVEQELVDAKLRIGRLEGELADSKTFSKALEQERTHLWRDIASVEVERDQLVNDVTALQLENTALRNEQSALMRAYDNALLRLAMYEGVQAIGPGHATQAEYHAVMNPPPGELTRAQYQQLMANQMQAQQAMLPNQQIGEHMIGLLGAIDPRGIWGPCTCVPARHDALLGRRS